MNVKESFPSKALEVIDQSIQSINFGEFVLIVQDGYIVQIERTERINISNSSRKQKPDTNKSINEINLLRDRILRELSHLKYGQLVVKIKDGKVVQIEKTEKRRFPEVEGIYGDGI